MLLQTRPLCLISARHCCQYGQFCCQPCKACLLLPSWETRGFFDIVYLFACLIVTQLVGSALSQHGAQRQHRVYNKWLLVSRKWFCESPVTVCPSPFCTAPINSLNPESIRN